jgi:hypothetical protein
MISLLSLNIFPPSSLIGIHETIQDHHEHAIHNVQKVQNVKIVQNDLRIDRRLERFERLKRLEPNAIGILVPFVQKSYPCHNYTGRAETVKTAPAKTGR